MCTAAGQQRSLRVRLLVLRSVLAFEHQSSVKYLDLCPSDGDRRRHPCRGEPVVIRAAAPHWSLPVAGQKITWTWWLLIPAGIACGLLLIKKFDM